MAKLNSIVLRRAVKNVAAQTLRGSVSNIPKKCLTLGLCLTLVFCPNNLFVCKNK